MDLDTISNKTGFTLVASVNKWHLSRSVNEWHYESQWGDNLTTQCGCFLVAEMEYKNLVFLSRWTSTLIGWSPLATCIVKILFSPGFWVKKNIWKESTMCSDEIRNTKASKTIQFSPFPMKTVPQNSMPYIMRKYVLQFDERN